MVYGELTWLGLAEALIVFLAVLALGVTALGRLRGVCATAIWYYAVAIVVALGAAQASTFYLSFWLSPFVGGTVPPLWLAVVAWTAVWLVGGSFVIAATGRLALSQTMGELPDGWAKNMALSLLVQLLPGAPAFVSFFVGHGAFTREWGVSACFWLVLGAVLLKELRGCRVLRPLTVGLCAFSGATMVTMWTLSGTAAARLSTLSTVALVVAGSLIYALLYELAGIPLLWIMNSVPFACLSRWPLLQHCCVGCLGLASLSLMQLGFFVLARFLGSHP